MVTITTNLLRRLAHQGSREDVRHEGVPGLYVRGQKSGRVSWWGRAVPYGRSKPVWYFLGDWSEHGGMTLQQATVAWLSMKGRLKNGEDPRQEAMLKPTVAEAVGLFLERHVQRNLRPSTQGDYRRTMNREVVARWADRKISTVARREVAELVEEIFKRCRQRGGRGVAANRTLAYVRKFFNWCVEQGFIEHSPAALVKAPAEEKPRERFLTRKEVLAVRTAIDGIQSPVFRAYLITLLYAGQRRGETSRMKWADVDFAGRVWTIPAEDAKNKRAHLVPLTDPVLAALTSLCHSEGSPWVFTTNDTAPISGFAKIKAELDALTPDVAPWNVHALRATMSTHLEHAKLRPETIGRLLNHKPTGVTSKHYALYDYYDEKRDALEKWAGIVEELASPMSRAA